MRTYIQSVHEEDYGEGEKKRTLGVLLNYSESDNFKESFVFIFNHKTKNYIFFNTIIEMFDFLLYGNERAKRAYMPEEEYDVYDDADFIEGKFAEILKWT